jgi:hypothetical protein
MSWISNRNLNDWGWLLSGGAWVTQPHLVVACLIKFMFSLMVTIPLRPSGHAARLRVSTAI